MTVLAVWPLAFLLAVMAAPLAAIAALV